MAVAAHNNVLFRAIVVMEYSVQSLFEALSDLARCEALVTSMLQSSPQAVGQMSEAVVALLQRSQDALADLRNTMPLL